MAPIEPVIVSKPPPAEAKAHVCDVCGTTARVQVLRGYRDGQPLMARLCLDCAAEVRPASDAAPSFSMRVSLPMLLCLAGATLALLGGLADRLVPSGQFGFGMVQRFGVLAGALLLLVSVLLHVDVMALLGLFVFAGAALIDFVGTQRTPGVGWKQQAALIVGGVIFVAAAAWRFARHRARQAAAAAAMPASGTQDGERADPG